MATAALLRDPRAVKLSNQLRGQAAALAARNITTLAPDYIDAVADSMLALGWADLTGIQATPETATGPRKVYVGSEGEFYIEDVEFTRLAWTFNGAPMYAAQSPDPEFSAFGDAVPVYEDENFRVLMEWLNPPGVPIIYMRRKYRANLWQGVAFVAGFAAMAAGLPGIIGNAVLGAEVAAAYPAAANAVGTIATKTVLTGGNVEAAIRSAATGFAGAEFGDVVGQAVDSPAFGAATAAATTAALAGGNARDAALAAAQGFVKSDYRGDRVSDYDPNDPYSFFDPASSGVDVVTGDLFSLDDLGINLNVDELLSGIDFPEGLDVPVDSAIPDEVGNLFAVDGSFIELAPTEYINSLYVDDEGNVRGPDNRMVLPSDEAYAFKDDPGKLSVAIENKLDLIAGTTVESWQPPSIRPEALPPAAAQTKVPVFSWADQADKLLKTAVSIGASIKAISTGTFRPPYATNPYGTPRSQVGVPVRRPDGSTVVNNGNGTQTVRFPDGRVQTMPTSYTTTGATGNYGQGLIPGIPNTALLIGGGLVVAALLLSRR